MSGPLQWTPNGLVPAVTGVASGGTQPGAVLAPVESNDEDEDDDRVEAPPVMRRDAKPASTVGAKKMKPATPKDVVRMARARLREVRAELRRMAKLTKERDELERLVAAAENKPRAVVRELPKRSAG